MDLAKYLYLLENSCLYFARPRMFDDPTEGFYPEANQRLRAEMLSRAGSPTEKREVQARIASRADVVAAGARFAINCWHQSDTESHALWKIYGSPLGVAIETTTERLIDALGTETGPVHIGLVRYVAYERVLIDFEALAPYLCKRRSFAHEREVRLLVERSAGATDEGVNVSVDVDTLVRTIYVNPEAPDWLREIVSRAAKRNGLSADVRQSELASEPATLEALPDLGGAAGSDVDTSSVAFHASVLMGQDIALAWRELLTSLFEGQIRPSAATIGRTGVDPSPMLDRVVDMMQMTINALRDSLGEGGGSIS